MALSLKISLTRIICLSLLTAAFYSCSTEGEGNGGANYSNLAEYLALDHRLDSGNVIACSASDKFDSTKVYTFFYPDTLSSSYKCFETDSVILDNKDFSLYKELDLSMEDVFNGYLKRFIRNDSTEGWAIVTFKKSGACHHSNPIRYKHLEKATEWTDQVQIDHSDALNPVFTWDDGRIKENVIYFQVISDENGDLLSGTYTHNKTFKYNDFSNVVFDVNRHQPPNLVVGKTYNFTLMAVSLDNWVNMVIEKDFTIQ